MLRPTGAESPKKGPSDFLVTIDDAAAMFAESEVGEKVTQEFHEGKGRAFTDQRGGKVFVAVLMFRSDTAAQAFMAQYAAENDAREVPASDMKGITGIRAVVRTDAEKGEPVFTAGTLTVGDMVSIVIDRQPQPADAAVLRAYLGKQHELVSTV
ncbi:hypothetical protein AB0368_38220 [Actinoplanes sp. NPDC051475]|uniref:hypothetical protein n=1 Tax=Actinoplanes sp. NPDC051475 TaxID=3157225 RepID=UPI00344B532D